MALSNQDRALFAGANLVAEAKSELDGKFQIVRGHVADAASAWAGSGSTQFQQTMLRWDDSVRKVTNALVDFEANLRKSQQDFDETDDAQRQSFAHLDPSRLGA